MKYNRNYTVNKCRMCGITTNECGVIGQSLVYSCLRCYSTYLNVSENEKIQIRLYLERILNG